MNRVWGWLRDLLNLLRGFCESMWWDLPLDWDEQVREAVKGDRPDLDQ